MTIAARTPASPSLSPARRRLQIAIEACWLAAIPATALLFNGRALLFHFTQPKQYALHLLALAIVSLWTFDYALSRSDAGDQRARSDWRFWRWAGRDPARWMLVFAGMFAVSQTLSTVLSPFPFVSFFGRDPNDSGYELYTGLSLLVIFAAVAMRVRTRDEVYRVLLTISVVGTVAGAYGVSQHFGWDPIGYGDTHARVYSTFGNAIFFASYLVMSIGATAAAYLLKGRSTRDWTTALAAVAVGLQVAALWFTASRGPLAAMAGGVVILGVAAFLLLGYRQALRLVVVGAVAALVAAVLVAISAPEVAGARSGFAAVGSILNQAAGATGSEVAVSNDELATDRLNGRLDVWKGALELLQTRETPVAQGAALTALRHLVGFGPDMYYFSYALAAPPQSNFITFSHAHNFLLQIWLEFGLLGLLSFVGLSLAALVVLVQLSTRAYRGRAHGRLGWLGIATVGLLGILAARSVEQMPGVARVGDLTTFWIVMGLVVAVAAIAGRELSPSHAVEMTRRPRSRPNHNSQGKSGQELWLGAGLGLAILSMILWIAFDGTAIYASGVAARANHLLNSGQAQAGYEEMKRATRIDRFSETYRLVTSQMERNAARSEDDRQRRLDTLLVAYRTLAEYEQTVPWAVNNDIRLTALTASIAELGVEQALGELGGRTVDLHYRMRPYPRVMAFVANSYVALGELEIGVDVADYAIETAESVGIEVSQAWWARGEALGRLERREEAVESLETATEVEPESRFAAFAHRTLADYFEESGDEEEAQRHRDKADEIEAKLASGN